MADGVCSCMKVKSTLPGCLLGIRQVACSWCWAQRRIGAARLAAQPWAGAVPAGYLKAPVETYLHRSRGLQ